jgi:N-acetylmuramoyl-L-alanine amidase
LTIVVDPGHGGRQPGALPRFRGQSAEKVIVLDIGLKLASRLRALGATVRTTRAGDTYLSLNRRAKIADNAKADFFVSIHVDSFERSDVSGATVLTSEFALPESKAAAEVIDRVLRQNGVQTRKPRAQRLGVLRMHSRPGVLIETGFLTNPSDAKNLNTEEYRERLALIIAEGIAQALER